MPWGTPRVRRGGRDELAEYCVYPLLAFFLTERHVILIGVGVIRSLSSTPRQPSGIMETAAVVEID